MQVAGSSRFESGARNGPRRGDASSFSSYLPHRSSPSLPFTESFSWLLPRPEGRCIAAKLRSPSGWRLPQSTVSNSFAVVFYSLRHQTTVASSSSAQGPLTARLPSPEPTVVGARTTQATTAAHSRSSAFAIGAPKTPATAGPNGAQSYPPRYKIPPPLNKLWWRALSPP